MRCLITPEEALARKKDICFIDVRSPTEYQKAAIPHAINIPLFDDSERHELGIIYKEKGAEAARMRGVELLSPKLPLLLKKILRICQNSTPVIYCWRGGMRSETVVAMLQLLKIPAYRLTGGYKKYRRFLFQALDNYSLKPVIVTLHGLTGVGKTKILDILKKEGCYTLDLESLANHRGSVFGSLGLGAPRSQKNFESLLWEELEKNKTAPYILVEGEGKKIGPVFMPKFLVEKMIAGHHVLLIASLEVRIQRILEEYITRNDAWNESVIKALNHLSGQLGQENITRIQLMLKNNNIKDAVRDLCVNHYDKLYKDSKRNKRNYAAVIDAENLSDACINLKSFLSQITQEQQGFGDKRFD